MADWDWYRIVSTAVVTILAIQYGRWTQRRDDRKARERANERRLAEAMAQQTLRGRNRGA